MPYVFYDTETTGTETAFDQILQFAAIKTDDDLNELDRFNIRCRLLPHIVPSPAALRATRITPAMLTDPALPSHYEAIRRIRDKLLEWSPAIFIGFNSIAFDEELLRQALFQTLHPAYLTNTNGNARADVMRVAHATSIYSPNTISVPMDDTGKQTFRLELLAPANGYDHTQAHEAMADVEATIYMARLIRDRAPEIWQAMDRAARKNAVIEYVSTQSMFSLTERYFGRTYSWLVTPCGQNPEYDGQLAVFDLYYDPDEYRSLSAEQLVGVLNASPKVIRSLRANAQPIMMPASAAPEGTKALQVPPDELRRRVEVIHGDPDFQARVGQAQALRFADEEPSPHVEERIYDGFPAAKDRALMEQFHSADWADRIALADQIADPRLSEFAYRLIYFERPDLLPSAKAAELNAWRAERALTEDEAAPWMTIAKALGEAHDLLKDVSGDDARLLRDVKDFLYSLADHLGSA
jgi:exodeoxyribonuclease-1